MEETSTTKDPMDEVVYSGTDAMVLGCLDKVGVITYREALAQADARLKAAEAMARATIQVAQDILKPRPRA